MLSDSIKVCIKSEVNASGDPEFDVKFKKKLRSRFLFWSTIRWEEIGHYVFVVDDFWQCGPPRTHMLMSRPDGVNVEIWKPEHFDLNRCIKSAHADVAKIFNSKAHLQEQYKESTINIKGLSL